MDGSNSKRWTMSGGTAVLAAAAVLGLTPGALRSALVVLALLLSAVPAAADDGGAAPPSTHVDFTFYSGIGVDLGRGDAVDLLALDVRVLHGNWGGLFRIGNLSMGPEILEAELSGLTMDLAPVHSMHVYSGAPGVEMVLQTTLGLTTGSFVRHQSDDDTHHRAWGVVVSTELATQTAFLTGGLGIEARSLHFGSAPIDDRISLSIRSRGGFRF